MAALDPAAGPGATASPRAELPLPGAGRPSPPRWPKPGSSCPAIFPPQAQTLDQGHGRIELRQLWCARTTPEEIGLAGVAQVVRIHSHVQEIRQGKVMAVPG